MSVFQEGAGRRRAAPVPGLSIYLCVCLCFRREQAGGGQLQSVVPSDAQSGRQWSAPQEAAHAARAQPVAGHRLSGRQGEPATTPYLITLSDPTPPGPQVGSI